MRRFQKTPLADKVRVERRLKEIAKNWPADLMLFSWSGSLTLIDLGRLQAVHESDLGCGCDPCLRSNEEMSAAIFCHIDGIYNDGGCP